MRMRVTMLLALLLGLCGCASIPLGTALSLSSLTPGALAQIDPGQVQVKLSVPEGYGVDVAASHLALALSGPSGSRSGEMGLAVLGVSRGVRPGGWFSPDIQVLTYSMALSAEGARTLRGLQAFVLSGKPNHFTLSVDAPFSKIPPSAREVMFWADLKLFPSEPFMPLVDGARIRIKDKPLDS